MAAHMHMVVMVVTVVHIIMLVVAAVMVERLTVPVEQVGPVVVQVPQEHMVQPDQTDYREHKVPQAQEVLLSLETQTLITSITHT